MKYSVFFLGCAVLALAGCTVPEIAVTGATAYFTKPAEPPPADTADQIPAHESWCYRTEGEPECFAHPQDVPPDRLISVDPASSYPIDLAAYRALVAKKVVAQPEAVVAVMPPTLPPPVVTKPLAKAHASAKKNAAHHKVGKHAKAKKPVVACKPVAKKGKRHVKDGTSPLANAPIPLQPKPAAAAAPVDLQAEKSSLQNEMSKDTPAPPSDGAPSGTAMPSGNAASDTDNP